MSLKVKTYAVLRDCVEAGVAAGLRLADKHAEHPLTGEQTLRVGDHIETEVMNAILEKFHFTDDQEN